MGEEGSKQALTISHGYLLYGVLVSTHIMWVSVCPQRVSAAVYVKNLNLIVFEFVLDLQTNIKTCWMTVNDMLLTRLLWDKCCVCL